MAYWNARVAEAAAPKTDDECRRTISAYQELGREMYRFHGASAYEMAEEIWRNRDQAFKQSGNQANMNFGEIYAGIAHSHAREHPQEAVATFRSMSPGPRSEGAEREEKLEHQERTCHYISHVYGLLSGWGYSDPEAALAFVGEGVDRIVFSMVGKAGEVAHFASREGKSNEMSQYGWPVYVSWAESDPISALRYAAGREQPFAFTYIYESWAAHDPRAATDYLLQGEPQNREAVQAVIGAWAAIDLDEALQVASELPATTGGPDRLLLEVGLNVYDESPELAASIYDKLAARGQSSLPLANDLASSWSYGDPQAAGDWVLSVADEKHRDSAFNKFLENFTRVKPRDAYEWAAGLDDDDYRARVLSRVAEDQAIWAKEIATAPEGRDAQIRIARYNRFVEEMPDPLTWIQELPPGPTKERVVAGYVSGHLSERSANQLGHYLKNNSIVELRVVEEAIKADSMPDDRKAQLVDLLWR
jgi:hypothetical protein